MNAITVENLEKVYSDGTRALKGIDLDIHTGDFFGLIGANGAGKTTMIGILTGLVNKTSGKARVFQYDLDTDGITARRQIGVVPQEFNFNIFEKVIDIVATQAGYFGVERAEALIEAEKLLKQLGIWNKRNLPARMLSGGMKRRLMIARALVHHPKLLILDEPTAGVDVELRHGMWSFLKSLNEEKGVTVLLTTHYLEEIEQMCRHAAIIKEGEIIKRDSVKNLVQVWEKETFIVEVEKLESLDGLTRFNPRMKDENTLEVEISRDDTLNHLISEFSRLGIVVRDIRPQGHRLEKLFLNILQNGRQ